MIDWKTAKELREYVGKIKTVLGFPGARLTGAACLSQLVAMIDKAAEPEDAFVPVSIPANFQAFADLTCLMVQKFGNEFSVSADELTTTKGWTIQFLYNARTKTLRLKAHHPADAWSQATPGVEAGHA